MDAKEGKVAEASPKSHTQDDITTTPSQPDPPKVTPPLLLSVKDEFNNAVRAVKNFKALSHVEPYTWLRFSLSPAAYNQLAEFLDNDDTFRGLETFYSSFTQEFAMGGETRVHAAFAPAVVRDILNGLARLEHPSLDGFGGNVLNTASAKLALTVEGSTFEKCPDGSLLYLGARFPGVVMEVAHSQRAEDLPRLAEDYILGSGGRVRCVVGFKLPYPAGNEATLSVWIPKLTDLSDGRKSLDVEQLVKEEVFCTADGHPNQNSAGLCLSLAYLAPTQEIRAMVNALPAELTEIKISTAELYEYLKLAFKAESPGNIVDDIDDEMVVVAPRNYGPA
ncbi:hypothetical protein AYO20_08868 [Fonsecaea nubica]|uniref:Uncharacterized protein n=1 Tax=Fonsecaea nubica TaxID=856822 RepID=A0A178CM14_9EURO|nr:hypothetical protein AYO20_08868 [Fonsecaea nubica]OAL30152.1 hypothetical protein AYO20_08868 [Fonsecaea nubica]